MVAEHPRGKIVLDPESREVNDKYGDDHVVNLSRLRTLAKRLKTQQELARHRWETDDTRSEAARAPGGAITPRLPDSPNCTSPFAPIWITEMVRQYSSRRTVAG